MGAQHGDGDTGRAGPRPGHHDAPATEALLAAALRRDHVDPEGERRAVAAFRAARDAAPARAARTRRRDDWRPRERRRAGRPLKTALSVTLASLTLGGVAYAAIGGGGFAAESAQPDGPRSSATTAGDGGGRGEGAGGADGTDVRPVPAPSPATTAPDAPARSGRPASAQETEEACRALQRLDGRGKALDAAVWEGLVAAAGGEEDVAAHCAEVRAGDARQDAGDGAEGLVPSVAPAPTGGPADAAGGAVGGTADGGADAGDAGDDGVGGAGGAGLDAGDGAAAGTAAGTVAGRSGLSPGTGGQP
ncbi:hypothetical protein [Streptomyces mutabilis]|uniref:hypothetical protein n=1 Tax=Streptomyces mutabilis TaxID=67332 RepID=UPI000693D86A|nr:hypothetical protein [Streptomyces mutabilis]